jgi:hypothetical protein
MKNLMLALVFPILLLTAACGSAGNCSPSAGVYATNCAAATAAPAGTSADSSSYSGYNPNNSNSGYGTNNTNNGYNSGYDNGYGNNGY